MQISLLKPVAEAFGLHAFDEVIVRKVSEAKKKDILMTMGMTHALTHLLILQADPKDAVIDFVEFTFKDNFISRADMWRFKNAIYGKAVYIGK